jgi:hypothetical protein
MTGRNSGPRSRGNTKPLQSPYFALAKKRLIRATQKSSSFGTRIYGIINCLAKTPESCHKVTGAGWEFVANEVPDKAQQYLNRAEELRVAAEAMTSIEARALILEIAQHYTRLAAALLKFGTSEIS